MKFEHKVTKLSIAGAASTILVFGLLFSAGAKEVETTQSVRKTPTINEFGGLAIAPAQTQAEVTTIAQTLAPEEVNLRAKQIVVRIDGANIGSGSIVERQNDTYTVLTNWHVMKNQGSYTLETIDGRQHQVIPSSIKQLPGLDLAILQFTTDQNYQTAEFGDSGNLTEGQIVYFAGYPGELRREDNRYYRFFTANIVGILPKSTDNGYSLIYSGEAFPGMSGGPVFSRDGVMVGVHGEANVNAVSGGTSNYAVPITSYEEAIAKLKTQPTAQNPTPAPSTQPESKPSASTKPPSKPVTSTRKPSEPINSNVSSVPTFSSGGNSATPPATKPEVIVEPETPSSGTTPVKQPELATKPTTKPEVIVEPKAEQPGAQEEIVEPKAEQPGAQEEIVEPKAEQPGAQEEIEVATSSRKISLISSKTGIDYTKLRDLLREKKWSDGDLHTYQLVEQIIQSAKNDNQHVFIELKTIAQYSCPDIRTIDSLWKKYSNDKFGFSPQQEIWRSVNQNGDFSTEAWRHFATEVGWKKGEVVNGSGYLLHDQLDFEPSTAPAGHLPWWFALPDEEQKVIKYLFARCNLNPQNSELEAEAKANANTAQNPGNNRHNKKNDHNYNQPQINKPPKSPSN